MTASKAVPEKRSARKSASVLFVSVVFHSVLISASMTLVGLKGAFADPAPPPSDAPPKGKATSPPVAAGIAEMSRTFEEFDISKYNAGAYDDKKVQWLGKVEEKSPLRGRGFRQLVVVLFQLDQYRVVTGLPKAVGAKRLGERPGDIVAIEGTLQPDTASSQITAISGGRATVTGEQSLTLTFAHLVRVLSDEEFKTIKALRLEREREQESKRLAALPKIIPPKDVTVLKLTQGPADGLEASADEYRQALAVRIYYSFAKKQTTAWNLPAEQCAIQAKDRMYLCVGIVPENVRSEGSNIARGFDGKLCSAGRPYATKPFRTRTHAWTAYRKVGIASADPGDRAELTLLFPPEAIVPGQEMELFVGQLPAKGVEPVPNSQPVDRVEKAVGLAQAYIAVGMKEKARQMLEEVIKDSPESPNTVKARELLRQLRD